MIQHEIYFLEDDIGQPDNDDDVKAKLEEKRKLEVDMGGMIPLLTS